MASLFLDFKHNPSNASVTHLGAFKIRVEVSGLGFQAEEFNETKRLGKGSNFSKLNPVV